MKESALERKCSKYSISIGYVTFKIGGSGYIGKPDRVFSKNLNTFFVEFKRNGLTASAAQKFIGNEIKRAGCNFHVIDSFEKFKELINC